MGQLGAAVRRGGAVRGRGTVHGRGGLVDGGNCYAAPPGWDGRPRMACSARALARAGLVASTAAAAAWSALSTAGWAPVPSLRD